MASFLVKIALVVLALCAITNYVEGQKAAKNKDLSSEPIKGSNLSLRRRLVNLSNGWPKGCFFIVEQVSNGEVVVWGGRQTDRHLLPRDVIYIYNPDANTWRKMAASGDIPRISDNCASVYHAGLIYIFGGQIGPGVFDTSRDIYTLDVKNGVFRLLPVVGKRPVEKVTTELWSFQGGIYFFGGRNARHQKDDNDLVAPDYSFGTDNLLARFDLGTYTWSAVKTSGPRPSPRDRYAIAKLGDSVFINGGVGEDRLGDMYKLDMNTLTWTALKGNGVKSKLHTLSPISNHHLLMVSGIPTNKVWVYDTSKSSWDEKAAMPHAQFGLSWSGYRRVVLKKKDHGTSVVVFGGRYSHEEGQWGCAPWDPLANHMLVYDIV